MDYDISIISFEMPEQQEGKKKEKGKGQLLAGVKMGYDKAKNKLTVERYAMDPVRLTNIQLHEKHKKEKTTDR